MKFNGSVHTAAREGDLSLLKKVLLQKRDKRDVEQLVSATIHGATPLVMACRYGHLDVAEYLITKCGADVNQPGSVMYEGECIEGASPLWCAAAGGNQPLVQLLVAKGANVNLTTKTNSTALRAACFDGRLDIVKYLVKHGADIEIANNHGHTCLMIAAYKGHTAIVKFLLEQKANTNRKTVKGNTALHDCAESGSLDVLKIIVDHGARMDVDSYGLTPVLAAALTGHTHIVEYLIGMPHLVSRKERIDALELLGAAYVDKTRDMTGALRFWERALEERYNGDGPVIPKPPPSPPVAAYNCAREFMNINELNELLAHPDDMRMQALLIRERILGPAHPDTGYYIRFRGAVYADVGRFSRCTELWHYALDMQQSMLGPLNPMTHSSLFSFVELFCFMASEEGSQTRRGLKVPQLEREELLRVFKKAILEVKSGKQMLDNVPASERDLSHSHKVLVITLHLACLLIRDVLEEGTEECTALYKALYDLEKINAKGQHGRTALQLALSDDVIVIAKYPVCKFPSLQLTTALLKVGADVSARDVDGNTPLHYAAMSALWRPEIAVTLLEAGAHIDAVNNQGKTFEDLLGDKNKYASINPMKYTTLACLAARVVTKTLNISMVPHNLVSFVKMHSQGPKSSCQKRISSSLTRDVPRRCGYNAHH